jgi:LDH2 family malate/lactate/ureidoglycolate dehydrogenase
MMPGRITGASLRRVVAAVAAKAGVPQPDATRFADALVCADEQGNATHGVSRLAIYIRRIQRGLIRPSAPLTVVQRRGAVLALDANHGLGQVQAVKTLDLLVPLAREHGIAAATLRNSQHFGTVSYYANLMAAQDLILLGMTNCEPAMSPEGGCEGFFGTNPIGASFPTDRGFPVKVDLATSVVARGNIIAAEKQGRPIPPGWALDVEGQPTTDPKAALNGTVLTMAGHKGYALAVLVEAFSSVLSGAAIGAEIGSMYKHLDRPQGVGHFFCLIDVAAFQTPAEFKARMGRMIDGIKGCRKRPGVEEILLPGERSARTAAANARHGVALAPAVRDELLALCGELGVAPDLEVSAT